MKALAKTKTQLMVLLMVIAVVALVATLVFSTVSFAKAEEVNNRDALVDRLSNAPNGTILQLTNDIEVDDTITVTRSGSVTLDLNGYMLRYGGTAASPVLTLTSGSLTIKSSANAQAPATHGINYRGETVHISGGLITGGKAGGVLVTGGSLNLESGTIAGNSTTAMDFGGGVTFKSSANNFNMSGSATISHNAALQGGGVYMLGLGSSRLVMDGGKIENNTATINGGGVFLTGSQGILFEIKKGSVSNNTATNGKGGGIYVDAGITAIISGVAASATYDQTQATRVNGNTAPSGAGVYLEKGTLQMSGGTVGSNNATSDGAGIHAKDSSLAISGGEVTNNVTTYGNGAGLFLMSSTVTYSNATVRGNQISAYGNGAGVYLNDASSSFTMTSGSITGNTILSEGNGGGVYFGAGAFNVSGSPVINDNAVGKNANNLFLSGSQTFVTVTGTVSASADVHVSVDSAREITKGYKTAGNTVAQGFTADVSQWSTVLASSGEVALKARTAATVLNGRTNELLSYPTIEQAFTAINAQPLVPFTLTLQADVETTATLTVSVRDLTLDLNGYMLRNTTTNTDVITVQPTAVAANVNFTIQDSRPQAGPHEVAANSYGVVPEVTTPTVKIYGGVIAGGKYGILCNDSASYVVNFVFRSGTIAGSTETGIHFPASNSNTTGEMYSGASVRYCAGGIRFNGTMRFDMYGGDVSYNSANGFSLSWVANIAPILTIHDGRINNNAARGILHSSGTVNFLGGDISYNGYAPSSNAAAFCGIYVQTRLSRLIMSGGTITHNAQEGIVIGLGQLTNEIDNQVTITGGEISYNGHEGVRLTNVSTTLTEQGNAVAQFSCNASISNATIRYNGWSGIYSKGILNVTDSTISTNAQHRLEGTASGTWEDYTVSNICVEGGTVTINNCDISGEQGIRVRRNTNSIVTVKGGRIHDSTSALTLYSGKIKLENVEIDHNRSTAIIGVFYATTLEIVGGRIHDNEIYSTNYIGGGALTMWGGTVTVSDCKMYDNNVLDSGGAITILGSDVPTAGYTTNLTLKDGTEIYGNTATNYGGAIYVQRIADINVQVAMEGGSIHHNSAMYGGGVAICDGTTYSSDVKFSMTGGEIRDNTAVYGAGIYLGNKGTLEMSGKPYVMGNTDLNGKANNLYLVGEQKINFTGEIGWDTTDINNPETFKVGITVESLYDNKVLSSKYSTTDSYKNLFVKGFVLDTAPEGTSLGIDNNEIIVVFKTGAGLIAVGKWDAESKTFTEVSQHGTWDAAYAAVTGENNAIQLLADLGVKSTITIDKTVVLDLNGYMIQSGTGSYLDTLVSVGSAAGKLTITDSTYIDGESTSEVTHWFQNPVTNKFEEVRGGVIHGKLGIGNGGNVEFDAGYIISGRSSSRLTGIDNFIITVSIVGNTSKFTMRDDAAICYNNGPAIYHDGGTTTIEGGKIFANKAVCGPAMVITAPGVFMHGGEIYGNYSGVASVNKKGIIHITGNGVATTNASDGEFTMTGGYVHDNTVKDQNGSFSCVYVGSSNGIKAKFTMIGGSIVNNKVEGHSFGTCNAGGIAVHTDYTVSGSQSSLILGGNAVVDGNTVHYTDTNSFVAVNVRLDSNSKIIVAKDLSINGQTYTGFTEGARIGVSLPTTANKYVFTDGYSSAGGMDLNIPFFADDPTNCLQFDMDGSLGKAGELILNAHTSSTLKYSAMTEANCKTGEKGVPELWHCDVCDRTFVSIDPFVEYDSERDDIVAEHQFTDYQYSTLYKHAARCTVCGETKELDHVITDFVFNGHGGHTGICSVCRADVSLACTYSGEENMRSSASSHWQQCSTCGAHYDEKAHVVEAGTSRRVDANNHVGTCSICKYDGVVAPHDTTGVEFVFDPANEDTQHYQICPDCNTPVHAGEHVLKTSEVEDDTGSYTLYECEICNYSSKTAHHVVGGALNHDANGHWYDCELHNGEKLNYVEHTPQYETHDGQHTITCADGCGYSLTENCTYRGYTYDEETATQGHYNVCSVCLKGADGEDKAYIAHGRVLKTNDDKHWFECPDCGYVVDSGANHSWQWTSNDERHWQYCASDECGITKSGTLGYHDFSGNWVTNGDDHWKVCSDCAKVSEQAKHELRIVSDGIDGHHSECSICRWEEAVVHAHNWESGYRTSTNGHFRRCDECFYSENEQAHVYDGQAYTFIGAGQHSRTCSVCERPITEACVNTYNVTDSTHVAECIRCHNVGTETPHHMVNASNAVYHWERCDVCNYSTYETAKAEHNFDNAAGICPTCGRSSDDPLASNRFDATFSLEEAAIAAKAKLKSDGKSVYEGLIDLILGNATAEIENSNSADEINAIVVKAIAEFNENVLRDRREYANAQFAAKEAELLASLPENLTAEQRAKYAQAISSAKAAAIAAVDNGTSVTAVDAEMNAGIAAMETAKVDTAKAIAKANVQQEAKDKKAELDAMTDVSDEQKQSLSRVIDKELARAEAEIGAATSLEEAVAAEARGINVIRDIMANPDLAVDKSQGRDDLEEEAQKKKDEIDQKVANGELTPAEGEEQKKAVDEELKKAQDKVTDAKDSDEIKDAVDKGKGDIGDATKPVDPKPGTPVDPEPAKSNWFEENALPVGIAGATLGVMLVVIIILAIAARKGKSK